MRRGVLSTVQSGIRLPPSLVSTDRATGSASLAIGTIYAVLYNRRATVSGEVVLTTRTIFARSRINVYGLFAGLVYSQATSNVTIELRVVVDGSVVATRSVTLFYQTNSYTFRSILLSVKAQVDRGIRTISLRLFSSASIIVCNHSFGLMISDLTPDVVVDIPPDSNTLETVTAADVSAEVTNVPANTEYTCRTQSISIVRETLALIGCVARLRLASYTANTVIYIRLYINNSLVWEMRGSSSTAPTGGASLMFGGGIVGFRYLPPGSHTIELRVLSPSTASLFDSLLDIAYEVW